MKKIAIIGTGYVGLVSGAGLSDFGHQVVCSDIDKNKISMLESGEIPIYEPGLESLVRSNVKEGRLRFSVDPASAIRSSDIIFIAVGTPQGENRKADLSAIKAVAGTIAENLNGYKIVCTKSTVPVGTGKRIQSIIYSKKQQVEFDYVSNPEFLREGASINDFMHPDRIIIGTHNEKVQKIMKDVYRPLYINETPILFTSVETAEMIKYASNAFLALKISYINEIANLCEAVEADVHEVARAMGQDGRISPKFLHPGPGFGGSCFPKDIQALAAMGREQNSPLLTIESAIEANKKQNIRMIDKLKTLVGRELKGLTIAVLGLSFKPETDDVRGAASRLIVPKLLSAGAKVNAYDPIASENFKLHYPEINYFYSWQNAVNESDACMILTEWNEFRCMDLSELKGLMKYPIVLDTKNILSMLNLEKLDFKFDNVGRKPST
jgi:UDPglucose 6-dehydrogenase